MRAVCQYFDFKWIYHTEDTDTDTDGQSNRAIGVPNDHASAVFDDRKHYIGAWWPHGIVPLGLLCGATYLDRHAPTMYGTFAVAPIVLRLPLLRQFFGLMNITDSSWRNLITRLRSLNVSICPGGIAEIFLISATDEYLYLKARKGFCRLSIVSGAEIVPIYMFGNSTLFDFVRVSADSWLTRFLRKMGIAIMLYWGRWGLPIPYRRKLTIVCGIPIPVTQCDNPTKEQVDELHSRVIDNVQLLYDKYKTAVGAAYEDRRLYIV